MRGLCENCIHYGVCVVNSYCHEPCGYYEEERPHGEWKKVGGIFYRLKCSNCNFELENPDDESKFCPNCGADMRKKRDGMNVSQTFVDEWIGEQQHGRDGKEGNVFTRR